MLLSWESRGQDFIVSVPRMTRSDHRNYEKCTVTKAQVDHVENALLITSNPRDGR